MQRVSLKFLAKELGIAEGTVSRALNDYPDISEATRERVKEVSGGKHAQANPTKNTTGKQNGKPTAPRLAHLGRRTAGTLKLQTLVRKNNFTAYPIF